MKKILTRKEFEKERAEFAKKMADDRFLRDKARDLLTSADRYNWIHQTNWLGEPILNTAEDMFAIQELVYRTRPEFIIESGVAWGGSLLFYSSLMELFGGQKIIAIDVYQPDDLIKRISSYGSLSERIIWINGSSTAEKTIESVRKIVGNNRKNIVILDSDHSHQHVLEELRIYSGFVGKGYHLICGDTIVEHIPSQLHRPRSWGPGNNPETARLEFLQETDRFEIDTRIENKLLMTTNPSGYLRAVKD